MNTLTAFIRRHRDAIVDEWVSRAALLPSSRSLAPPTLRDHVPAIVDRIADAVDRRDTTTSTLANLPEQHAALRFREGYDLRQVVAEYRLLREVILELYAERGDLSDDSRPKMTPLTVMNEAVDHAIAEAVDQYAVERDRVRDTFVAILGHDLRQPLHAMLFSANALAERADELDARTVTTVARIAANGKRMDRMIRDVLDFARGRLGGGFAIVPTPFDARDVIAQTVKEIADAYPDRTIPCVATPATGDFRVEWDSDRITQVVTNLVGNALLHGQDPVVVELTDEGAYVAIAVSNVGAIPPDVLPHLFDAFSPDASDKPRKGLGLGLYIVQQIARAHGGDVSAEPADGTTTIRVRLPRRGR